jgi:histidine triad (HIT) family protein
MMIFAKQVAHKIKMAIPCKKIGIAVIGLEVPHAHIHLVPLQQIGDLNFSKSKLTLSKEKMLEIQELILRQI